MVFMVSNSIPKMRISLLFCWSTERELNPRILVLQTSALATSPSVLLAAAHLDTSMHGGAFVPRAYRGWAVVRRYGFTVL